MNELDQNWPTPPPPRPAPDQLRHRIAGELDAERRRGRFARTAAALVAAVVVLTAAVFGAAQWRTSRQAVPAASPSATPSSTPLPSASPTPASTAPSTAPDSAPEPQPIRALSEQQRAESMAACLADDSASGSEAETPHRGTYRALAGLAAPTITLKNAQDDSVRAVVAQDDVGYYTCIDGKQTSWSAVSPDELRQPSDTVPAVVQVESGTSGMCNPRDRTGTESWESYWAVTDKVASARIELTVDGDPIRTITLLPADHYVVLAFRLSGADLYRQISWTAEFLDEDGKPLTVGSESESGYSKSRRVESTVRSCADRENPTRPQAINLPASDAEGVRDCRAAVAEQVADNGATFDAQRAEPVLTTSSSRAWGTILRDGSRYATCSRYPTKEISDVRTAGNDVKASTFGWAQNPIPTGGESLWAAGRISGLRTLTYVLPGGRQVAARVTADGWWLVMASTTSAFDTEESRTDWEPVRVEVVTDSGRKTFELPWTTENSCNQVSHGC